MVPPISSHASAVDRYWAYIFERQSIWYRRFVECAPAPWTEDPILAGYSFTNVYRELDKGTIYYLGEVRDVFNGRYPDMDEALLVATILYRFFNRWETWEYIKGALYHYDAAPGMYYFDWDLIEAAVRERAKVGPAFTSAHMVCAYHQSPGTDKIDKVLRFVRAIDKNRSVLLDGLRRAATPLLAWKLLTQYDGVGPFNAYEVYSDLMYTKDFLPFAEDDWANAGPGAQNGLRVMFPGRRDWLTMMYELRDGQREAFDRLGLPFESVALDKEDFSGTRWLTMRNIEHNLCEFFKYNRGSCRTRFDGSKKGSKLIWTPTTV